MSSDSDNLKADYLNTELEIKEMSQLPYTNNLLCESYLENRTRKIHGLNKNQIFTETFTESNILIRFTSFKNLIMKLFRNKNDDEHNYEFLKYRS